MFAYLQMQQQDIMWNLHWKHCTSWFLFHLWSLPLVIRVKIQLKRLARAMYSNPPVHGARIVANIVRDRNLFEERKQEMELMAGRIKNVRRRLHENLSQKDKHAGVIGLLSSSRLACPHILVWTEHRYNKC